MDNVLSFDDAVQCAKQFEDFDGVLKAVSLHPEWLTTVPGTRKWAIIHHVVYSGNTDHLDQLLAPQYFNKSFRLLVASRDNETVLDIARVLNDDKKMYKHVERLAKLDEMLNYARECQWDKCYEIVKEHPTYGNEIPPYRRYFLIHHIAFANAIDQFERFQKLENFQFVLTVRVDRRKINIIARDNKQNDFAKYLEKTYPQYFDEDNDDVLYEQSEKLKRHTSNVNTLIEQRTISQDSGISFGPANNKPTRGEYDQQFKQKLLKQQEEKKASQAAKSVIERPTDIVRNLLTCSLTKAIVTDPVLAADGFTYERSAIENWFKTNDCSPMTNEKLTHKNLTQNKLVMEVLASITV